MIIVERASAARRLLHSVAEWLQQHAVTLVRTFTVLAVIAVTAVAGYLCHGLIGPPG